MCRLLHREGAPHRLDCACLQCGLGHLGGLGSWSDTTWTPCKMSGVVVVEVKYSGAAIVKMVASK